jgi:hypothetical protein
MVVVIGMAYKMFGGLPWMQAIFYGVGCSSGRNYYNKQLKVKINKIR